MLLGRIFCYLVSFNRTTLLTQIIVFIILWLWGGRRAYITVDGGLVWLRRYLGWLHAIHIDSLLDLLIEYDNFAKRGIVGACCCIIMILHVVLPLRAITFFAFRHIVFVSFNTLIVLLFLQLNSSFAYRPLRMVVDLLSLLLWMTWVVLPLIHRNHHAVVDWLQFGGHWAALILLRLLIWDGKSSFGLRLVHSFYVVRVWWHRIAWTASQGRPVRIRDARKTLFMLVLILGVRRVYWWVDHVVVGTAMSLRTHTLDLCLVYILSAERVFFARSHLSVKLLLLLTQSDRVWLSISLFRITRSVVNLLRQTWLPNIWVNHIDILRGSLHLMLTFYRLHVRWFLIHNSRQTWGFYAWLSLTNVLWFVSLALSWVLSHVRGRLWLSMDELIRTIWLRIICSR